MTFSGKYSDTSGGTGSQAEQQGLVCRERGVGIHAPDTKVSAVISRVSFAIELGVEQHQDDAHLPGSRFDDSRQSGAVVPRTASRPIGSAISRAGRLDRDALVVGLLPLVRQTAFQMRKCLPPWLDVSDLIGAGILGLMDAVHKFDSQKGVKPATYARCRIRGAMVDYLRSLDGAPRGLRKESRRAEAIFRDLSVKFGRPPTSEEMAGALRLRPAGWHRVLRDLRSIAGDWTLPMVTAAPRGLHTGEPVTGKDYDPYELCWRREQESILRQAIGNLPRQEWTVVYYYYRKRLTMKQIGGILHLCEARVCQVHSSALQRIRRLISK